MEPIPDLIHFVWSGARFPYFARLAMESALVAEPRADLVLHCFDTPPCGEHFEAIRSRQRVTVATFDPASAFANLGCDAHALHSLYVRIPPRAMSARSNLIRYAVLARSGGIYLDTDVLVVRGFGDLRVHDAFVGHEQVLSIDNAWQRGERSLRMVPAIASWLVGRNLTRLAASARSPRLAALARRLEPWWQVSQVNNAVIGARPGARFVRRLLERALATDPRVRFALGPALIDEVTRAHPSDVVVLPPSAFYVEPPSYSFRFFTGGPGALPADTRVLHVVASNHRALLGALDRFSIQQRATRGPYYQLAAAIDLRARHLAAAPAPCRA